MQTDPHYDLTSVNLPRLSGTGLRLVVRFLKIPGIRSLLLRRLLRDAGIERLRSYPSDDPPTYVTSVPTSEPDDQPLPAQQTDGASVASAPLQRPAGFSWTTSIDYAAAYRSGALTPEDVAHRILAAIQQSDAQNPPLRAFIASQAEDIIRQAQEATQRWQHGVQQSLLDGVPVAVKDEVDQVPYGTTVGTRFLGRSPATADATVVARLRAAGALLIGKTNMHEIGIGVTGASCHHGTVRNPYHPGHHSGGSSSGSAAAVAAGLCPIAIGADGGGSIRIPAAFCGVVGLKPTYGRVSTAGAAPLDWSVGHLGPIGATTRDVVLAYQVIAGPDPRDRFSLRQPAPTVGTWDLPDLDGLTLGIYRPWFNHATSAVVSICDALVAALEARGARVREIDIPDLEAARVAHLVTITSEVAAAMDRVYRQHRTDFSLEVQFSLALARALTARDYVQAQRIRTRTMANFARVLAQVDAIITPTTAQTAPPIRQDAPTGEESDVRLVTEIMRFVFPANLTGLPAITFPAGCDSAGLPVGLQAIGRPWSEHILLRLAHVAEQIVERPRPAIHYAILPDPA